MQRHLFSSRTSSPLSNFHSTKIEIWGMSFHCSEQAYQFFKCQFNREAVRGQLILHAKTAKQCYFIGKECSTSKLWDEEKPHVMLHILKKKFFQCPEFRVELEKFKDYILVEDTSNHFWGRGVNDQGLNTLGVLLHKVWFECGN